MTVPGRGQPPLSESELKVIRERCEKATAGPWTHHTFYDGATTVATVRDARTQRCVNAPIGQQTFRRSEENADFLAAARTDVPRLLAEIDRLRAVRAPQGAAAPELEDESGHTLADHIGALEALTAVGHNHTARLIADAALRLYGRLRGAAAPEEDGGDFVSDDAKALAARGFKRINHPGGAPQGEGQARSPEDRLGTGSSFHPRRGTIG